MLQLQTFLEIVDVVNGYCYVKKWCNWWAQMQTNKNLLPQQFVKNIVENFFVCNITIGSRFSDWAHYNEFVESGAKSWVLMRRRLVLGMKGTQNQAAQHPREKGPLARGREYANPSRSRRSLPPVSGPPLLWAVSLVIYSSLPFILLLHLLVIHAYLQVHIPSAILSGALWAAVAPIALFRGHIHIKGGQGVNCVYLIRRWQLFLGLPPHLFPYG